MNDLASPWFCFSLSVVVFHNSLQSAYWMSHFTCLSGEISAILHPGIALGSFFFFIKKIKYRFDHHDWDTGQVRIAETPKEKLSSNSIIQGQDVGKFMTLWRLYSQTSEQQGGQPPSLGTELRPLDILLNHLQQGLHLFILRETSVAAWLLVNQAGIN